MKRVIIFHISEFGGHSKAAQNIKEALQYREPAIHTVNIDGLKYFYPFYCKIVDTIYAAVIKHAPSIWGKAYDRDLTIKSLLPLRKWINRLAFRKLSRLFGELNPSCCVATQAFPCGIVADFKKKFNLKIPLIAVVTDYYPHRFWVHPFVDRYVVACDESKEVLVREGVSEEKIRILGIPVSLKFLDTHSKDEISKDFNFLPNRISVLIMGGGWGIGPIDRIAQQLDALDCDSQTIVLCGRNRKLLRWFNLHRKEFRKPLFYFGYIDFVHKLMDFSDIIITKGGGITVSEALSKGLVIMIANPIPGQEERNVNYLCKNDAIIKVDRAAKVGGEIKKLLEDKKKMYFLKEQARKISFIDSSLRIVDLILGEVV